MSEMTFKIKTISNIAGHKMLLKFKIIFYCAILLLFFCKNERNLLGPLSLNEGYRKLTTKTEKDIYFWQQDETNKYIVIQGTVVNNSIKIYYSRIGDGFDAPKQDHLFLADNSAGYIEKYSGSDQKWTEMNILGILIEGSQVVPITPEKNYMLHAHLSIRKDVMEIGKYRFRIDYYNSKDQDSSVSQFCDYSNIFEIK